MTDDREEPAPLRATPPPPTAVSASKAGREEVTVPSASQTVLARVVRSSKLGAAVGVLAIRVDGGGE